MKKSIYLGNWGPVVVHSDEHEEYVRACYNENEVTRNDASWNGNYGCNGLKQRFAVGIREARERTDKAFSAMPPSYREMFKRHHHYIGR